MKILRRLCAALIAAVLLSSPGIASAKTLRTVTQAPVMVGSLQLFRPPEGAGPEFLREMYEDLISKDEMAPLFRKRAARAWLFGGQWGWQAR